METKRELTLFVNYETKSVEEDYPDDKEFKQWLDKGYIRVDLDTYLTCRDKFFKQAQARMRKTLLQRQRRQREAKPIKVKKLKIKKECKSLEELLK